jgi:hypothetical protein
LVAPGAQFAVLEGDPGKDLISLRHGRGQENQSRRFRLPFRPYKETKFLWQLPIQRVNLLGADVANK